MQQRYCQTDEIWQVQKKESARYRQLLFFLLLALFFAVWGGLSLGTTLITAEEIWHTFQLHLGGAESMVSLQHSDIVWYLRLPRILLAMLAGGGLALCGAVMQAIVQNPLAEPYLLGVSAGASLGAASIILFGGIFSLSAFLVSGSAFVGAMLSSGLVWILSVQKRRISLVKIILAGTAINALFLSLTNFLIYLSDNVNALKMLTFWTMGSLAGVPWEKIWLPALCIPAGCVYFFLQARVLNVLLLGEEAAITLGISLQSVRKKYLIICAVLTAVIVSACGAFGFVGLVIPHFVRIWLGADHKKLLPAAVLCGAIFLTAADILTRMLLPGGELPIGIITSLVGAPFFLYMLFSGQSKIDQ